MPTTLEEFKSFFLPGDTSDPRVNPDLRKRIALAMMARQRKAPQNIGEGIYSVGESIGDVLQQRAMQQADIAQTEKLKGLTAAVEGADTAPAASVPTGVGAVSRAALAPPVAGDSTEPFAPPPPPVTRSAGVPSPLPANPTGAMPQPAPQQMITPMGTNTIAPPPGALPGSPRDLDPRARAALLLASRRGGPPPGPTEAGGALPAPMPPLAPPTGGPSPVPMSQGPGGNPLDANAQMSALPPTTAGQNIRPAPAPPPPRLVRPEPPGEPTPPGQVPLTPVQQRAIATARQHPQDADVQRVMKDLYDREEPKRAFQQSILNKRYETQLEIAKEQRAQNTPEALLKVDKLRAEIAAGKVIQMDGRLIRIGEDGRPQDITPSAAGVAEGGPPQVKMTQSQEDTIKFYEQVQWARQILDNGGDKILNEGRRDEILGKVPFVGNALLSAKYRAAKQAATIFTQAELRDISGATIGTKEFADRWASTMPSASDDPGTVAQKRDARARVAEGMRLSLGTARPMADFVDTKLSKLRETKTAVINKEMEGKDKSRPWTNPRTKLTRVWDPTDQRWEEF